MQKKSHIKIIEKIACSGYLHLENMNKNLKKNLALDDEVDLHRINFSNVFWDNNYSEFFLKEL